MHACITWLHASTFAQHLPRLPLTAKPPCPAAATWQSRRHGATAVPQLAVSNGHSNSSEADAARQSDCYRRVTQTGNVR
jgi:hypothetical protein